MELLDRAREQDALFKELYSELMYSGSYFKGTKVGKPEEYDLNLILKLPDKKENFSVKNITIFIGMLLINLIIIYLMLLHKSVDSE